MTVTRKYFNFIRNTIIHKNKSLNIYLISKLSLIVQKINMINIKIVKRKRQMKHLCTLIIIISQDDYNLNSEGIEVNVDIQEV